MGFVLLLTCMACGAEHAGSGWEFTEPTEKSADESTAEACPEPRDSSSCDEVMSSQDVKFCEQEDGIWIRNLQPRTVGSARYRGTIRIDTAASDREEWKVSFEQRVCLGGDEPASVGRWLHPRRVRDGEVEFEKIFSGSVGLSNSNSQVYVPGCNQKRLDTVDIQWKFRTAKVRNGQSYRTEQSWPVAAWSHSYRRSGVPDGATSKYLNEAVAYDEPLAFRVYWPKLYTPSDTMMPTSQGAHLSAICRHNGFESFMATVPPEVDFDEAYLVQRISRAALPKPVRSYLEELDDIEKIDEG